ncbi:MAG TPA: hypothetical protein VN688_07985 [Gemmataceae bacterium]|nr:hypothetical protein [Gemmataceae bacterium]
MKETRITLPELALIAGTRAAAGAGLGLLVANRLSESQRRAIGWTLLLVGAITTVPLALEVFGRRGAAIPAEAAQNDKAPRSRTEAQLDRPTASIRI